MPYSGPSDPELPERIRGMGLATRRRWVGAWNGAFDHCRSRGDQDCEGYAFRVANAAIKGGKGVIDAKAIGEKILSFLGLTPTGDEDEEIKKAVWTTAFINDLPDSAFLHIEGGGKKDEEGKTVPRSLRHFPYQNAVGAVDLPHLRNAIARAPQSALPQNVIARVQERGRAILERESKAFRLVKDLHGDLRWLVVASNNFEDRDGEIITEKAHKDFVRAVEDGESGYPELWVWHVPGSRVGKADFVGYADGFLLTSGTVDKGQDVAAERLSKMEGLAASHGFVGRKEGRDIVEYRSHEVSVVPVEIAANPFTAVEIEEVTRMPLEGKQREFLAKVFDEDQLAAIESTLKGAQEGLKGAGVEHKTKGDEGATSEIVKAVVESVIEALDIEGLSVMVKAIKDGQDVQAGAISESTKALADLLERVAKLERSDDEKVATVMAPRSKEAPVWAGFRASRSEETRVTKEEAEAKGAPKGDFLDEIIQEAILPALVR